MGNKVTGASLSYEVQKITGVPPKEQWRNAAKRAEELGKLPPSPPAYRVILPAEWTKSTQPAVLIHQEQEPDQAPSKHIPSLAEVMGTHIEPPQWIIEGAVPKALFQLTGPPKVGKSLVALEMALAVATGAHWMGRATKRGRVLLVALEDGPGRLQSRFGKMLNGSKPPENLFIMSNSRGRWQDWGETYQGARTSDWLAQFIVDAMTYDWVILDTFSRAFGDIDQNDNNGVQSVLAPLQEAGVAVTIVDHTKKGGGRVKDSSEPHDATESAAGSRAKGALTEGSLSLRRHKKGDLEMIRLDWQGRDAEEWTLDAVRDSNTLRLIPEVGLPESDRVSALSDLERDVWSIIQGHRIDGISQADIREELGLNEAKKSAVHRACKKLVDLSLTATDPAGKIYMPIWV